MFDFIPVACIRFLNVLKQYKQNESEWRGLCPIFPKTDINQKRGFGRNAAIQVFHARQSVRTHSARNGHSKIVVCPHLLFIPFILRDIRIKQSFNISSG